MSFQSIILEKKDGIARITLNRPEKLNAVGPTVIQDMTAAYNRANLVVSRAGATTIFELAAIGKPSILIPYPYATNQHQKTNALSMVRAGGAEMVREAELNGEFLAEVLKKYMNDPGALVGMARNARSIARMDAAKTIVDHLLDMIRESKN